jgi:murein DD-endopeptidase MepM/ murein hydrolase activator NlpD
MSRGHDLSEVVRDRAAPANLAGGAHPDDREAPPVLRARASVPWRGASLARLVEAASRIETGRRPHWSDWWIHGVLPLAVFHLTLFLTLQARPGPLALVLWRWGPAVLVMATVPLLVTALLSAIRSRLTWSWRRAVGLAGLCALVGTMGVYQTFPSSYDRMPSAVNVRLPLDGPVTVAWGGPTADVNYHVNSPGERWAYDLLITNDGRSHRESGHALADYFANDRPVRAPAAGRVIEVHDRDPDAPPGRPDRKRGGGNQVVLEIAPRQYLFIAHLRAGSIRVVPGQWVRQDEIVGRVGNSGNTSEPHVHLHLQDTAIPDAGQAIPFYFSNYFVLSSGRTMARGMPQGGVRRGRFVGDLVMSIARGGDIR